MSDIDIVLNRIPLQFFQADEYYRQVQSKADEMGFEVYLTGHSLGAVLAQLVAAKYNKETDTSSSPSIYGILRYIEDYKQGKAKDCNLIGLAFINQHIYAILECINMLHQATIKAHISDIKSFPEKKPTDKYKNIENYILKNDLLLTLSDLAERESIGENNIIDANVKGPIKAHIAYYQLATNENCTDESSYKEALSNIQELPKKAKTFIKHMVLSKYFKILNKYLSIIDTIYMLMQRLKEPGLNALLKSNNILLHSYYINNLMRNDRYYDLLDQLDKANDIEDIIKNMEEFPKEENSTERLYGSVSKSYEEIEDNDIPLESLDITSDEFVNRFGNYFTKKLALGARNRSYAKYYSMDGTM